MKEQCHRLNKGEWATCLECEGRIHLQGCKAKMSKDKDCCLERHLMLFQQGQKTAIYDSGLAMLGENMLAQMHLSGIDIEPYKTEKFRLNIYNTEIERLTKTND